jgi:hypothetical protein
MAEMFSFSTGGIGVMPDPDDNEPGHINPNHESGTRISFDVVNVGDAAGSAAVAVELDGSPLDANFESSVLQRNQTEAGFVALGRLSEGSHSVLIFVSPARINRRTPSASGKHQLHQRTASGISSIYELGKRIL